MDIWGLVIHDMYERNKMGMKRYGVPLVAGNGKDALRECYEEILDAAVYLRQVIEERDNHK